MQLRPTDVAMSRERLVEEVKSALESGRVQNEVQDRVLAAVTSILRGLELKASAPVSEATALGSPPTDLIAPAVPRVIHWLAENKKNFKSFLHQKWDIFETSGPLPLDRLCAAPFGSKAAFLTVEEGSSKPARTHLRRKMTLRAASAIATTAG